MSLSSRLKQLIDKYGVDGVEEALTKLKRVGFVSIRDDIDAAIDNWAAPDTSEPTLFNMNLTKRSVPRDTPIEKTSHTVMYRLCYSVETAQQSLTLDSTQRGRVASILGKLSEAGADLSQLNYFEDWWKTTWRSKDKQGTYHPPRPEQVLECWWVAMKALQERKSKDSGSKQIDTTSNIVDFEERMRQKALQRRNLS